MNEYLGTLRTHRLCTILARNALSASNEETSDNSKKMSILLKKEMMGRKITVFFKNVVVKVKGGKIPY